MERGAVANAVAGRKQLSAGHCTKSSALGRCVVDCIVPTLTRHLSLPGVGMYGELSVDGHFWPTVEKAADDAEHPCIPAGTYPLQLGTHHAGTPQAYPCYWVLSVPGRSAIQIHIANLPHELRGCIAPGAHLGWFAGVLGVTGSRAAFSDFMHVMQQKAPPGDLAVIDPT